mmetsp:Transcript_17346/g.60610  ORF Transcript_17346/g.60610 Transcript_17346/m.60610 type:complete len:278 (+) Transcript_17346:476-1309(+)
MTGEHFGPKRACLTCCPTGLAACGVLAIRRTSSWALRDARLERLQLEATIGAESVRRLRLGAAARAEAGYRRRGAATSADARASGALRVVTPTEAGASGGVGHRGRSGLHEGAGVGYRQGGGGTCRHLFRTSDLLDHMLCRRHVGGQLLLPSEQGLCTARVIGVKRRSLRNRVPGAGRGLLGDLAVEGLGGLRSLAQAAGIQFVEHVVVIAPEVGVLQEGVAYRHAAEIREERRGHGRHARHLAPPTVRRLWALLATLPGRTGAGLSNGRASTTRER